MIQSSKGRILLVEDHQDTAQIFSLYLRMWGYEVANAKTLAEALGFAKAGEVDLYMLDGKLPDGAGVELCQHIREFDADTPILFCSASAYPLNVEEAKAAGAQEYLAKPVDPEILETTVLKLLRSKSHNMSNLNGAATAEPHSVLE